MADKILMTALSPTMEMGTILEWKVKEGDAVKSGDVLCEVETDKASMELLSDFSGTILKIIKDKGSEVAVGELIGVVGKQGEDISSLISASPISSAPSTPAPSPAPSAPTQSFPPSKADKVLMTALSPTMEKGTILEWNVKEGDSVKSGDVLCEVETDKASMELLSDFSGTLLKIIRDKGSEVAVGEIIGAIGKQGEDISSIIAEAQGASAAPVPAATPTPVANNTPPTPAPSVAKTMPQKSSVQPQEGERIIASPLARKLAAQKGINLNDVQGSGLHGRIMSRDLDNARAPLASVQRQTSTSGNGSSSLNDERIPLTGKRKVIAQRLTESKNSAPHFYLMTSIVMDDLLASRDALNKTRKEGKISVNAFLMKLIAQVITRHQIINSSWEGDAIQNHSHVDIGLAVAQPDGLITPIVKSCEQKGIVDIDMELSDLISRARNNRLKPEEYSGATFTISSLGSMGIEQFTSIINPPGVAILAIGSVKKEVVVGEKDELEIKNIMKVSLSCDHRVVDGAVGAKFLKDLKDTLENPIRALF